MKEDPKDKNYVLNADLLAPEWCWEIIWWSERESDYQKLLDRIKEEKLPVEYFNRYLDLRKYGWVPHSWFGFGLERLVRWICNLHHIRESIPFPRYANRITP
jgi:asparaginyl-tRNA synthetase